MPIPYRLDDLGWLQFEELCQAYLKVDLGLGVEAWGGTGDFGKDAFFEGALPFPRRDVDQLGPFLFQAKFVAAANAAGSRPGPELKKAVKAECVRITKRIERGTWQTPLQYVLMSNVVMGKTLRRDLTKEIAEVLPDTNVAFQDGQDVSTALDSLPRLRLSFPQILGLRDLKGLLRDEVLADVVNRSQFRLGLAHDAAALFVPTRAYRQSLFVLENHRFVVLTGPPEVGKTTIARMLGLGMLGEGWEIHECASPQDLLRAYRRDTRQVFVADDAFGTTEYHPDKAHQWGEEMEGILRGLDRQHRLIWTSRSAVLRAALAEVALKGAAEKWPDPGEVEVDATRLSPEEKTLILYRHAKAAGLSDEGRDLLRQEAPLAVKHADFTPERISRLVRERLSEVLHAPATERRESFRQAVELEMTQATKSMRQSYRRLESVHQLLLVAMLDAGSGTVTLDNLTTAYKRHGGTRDIADPLDMLSGHFVRAVPAQGASDTARVEWMHPSWRDVVIDHLGSDAIARRDFMQHCSINGFLLALSTEGGAEGKRRRPLLQEPEDWDALIERARQFIGELDDWGHRQALAMVSQVVGSKPDEAQLSAPESELVRTVLDAVRSVWKEHLSGVDLYSLELYFRISLALKALPASPELKATWEVYDPSVEILQTVEDDFLDGSLATKVEAWIRLAMAVRSNEPRLLAQVHFPAAYTQVIERIVILARNEAEAEVSLDGPGDMRSRAEDLSDLATGVRRLACLAPAYQEQLIEVADVAAHRSEVHEEEAGDIEARAEEMAGDWEWEPEPDDELGLDDERFEFDIAAVMADL